MTVTRKLPLAGRRRTKIHKIAKNSILKSEKMTKNQSISRKNLNLAGSIANYMFAKMKPCIAKNHKTGPLS